MINHFPKVIAFFIFSILLLSCDSETVETKFSDDFKKQLPVDISYAKGFTIDTIIGGLQRIIIQDLAQNKEIAKYILVPKGSTYLPEDNSTVIYTPIENIGILSSSYIGYLDLLNKIDNITLIENHSFIYNKTILDKYHNGSILEVGSNGQINLEKLVLNSPEILFTSAFNGGLSDELLKAREAGIETIQCSEWQENHPLARAEWIKLFGALTDKENLADSLFKDIEEKYHAIVSTCNSSESTPKALFSSMYQDTWYIPGGKSYLAQIVKDVNGTYAWWDNDQTGSLLLSFETVAAQSLSHDIWINPEVNSIKELIARDARYQNFIDQNKHGIYQQNAKTNAHGGNDYWESGVVRPDLVLQDFGKMFHPLLFENVNFTYFNQLK